MGRIHSFYDPASRHLLPYDVPAMFAGSISTLRRPSCRTVCLVATNALAATEDAASALRTGAIGDGKIFVSEVAEAIRIRDDTRGESAL